MIGLAIALVAALVAATGGALLFALRALGSERRAGELSRALAVAEAAISVGETSLKTETLRADYEKRRADGLEKLFADAALVGPVDGAYDRLLKGWLMSRHHSDGDGTRAVPVDEAPRSDDDLMRPGE